MAHRHRARATGLVWHERMMWHDAGSGASELSAGGSLEPGEHAGSDQAAAVDAASHLVAGIPA